MTDQEIIDALAVDLAAGTEAFRDELLSRCLAVLAADNRLCELDDEDLELLAAAGDMLYPHGTIRSDNGAENDT